MYLFLPKKKKLKVFKTIIPAVNHMFKVRNRNTRTTCEVCSKLTKTPRQRQWYPSCWCLYCQLWTYFTPCSIVSIFNFEQVNAGFDNFKQWFLVNFCSSAFSGNTLLFMKTGKPVPLTIRVQTFYANLVSFLVGNVLVDPYKVIAIWVPYGLEEINIEMI